MDVPTTNKELRATFRSGRTKSMGWRRNQLLAFRKMITEGKPDLCRALKADLHKSDAEGYFTEINLIEHEIQAALDHMEEWAAPDKVATDILNQPGWSYVYKDPLGICLIIGAWNYPVQLTLLPMVGALAAGNCVCIKVPSEKYSKESSRTMARLVRQYMDKTAVQVVEGDRSATQAVLAERWDHIFFTGSPAIGRMVGEAAGRNLTPVVLELGGKSPCIVDRTADVGVAAKRVAWGAFMNCGQTCVRPDWMAVHEDVADKFIEAMKKRIQAMYTANPKGTEFFGRLINDRAFDRINGILEADKSHIVFGGDTDKEQRFVSPTILDFHTDLDAFGASGAMEDEIFGPIMPVIRYRNLDTILQFINEREKPLSMYVFTGDKSVRQRVLQETTSGSCDVNDVIMHMTNELLPFGGVGQSGMGAYHGKRSFDCFVHHKAVLVKTPFLDAPQRYPPYTPFNVALLGFIQKPRSKFQLKIMKAAFFLLVLAILSSKLGGLRAILLSLANMIPE